jgi:hypothetical protein
MGETSPDYHEYYKERIKEALERVLKLDDCIHDLLSDDEYYADMAICEDYIDTAKLAIHKPARGIDKRLPERKADLTLSETSSAAVLASSSVHSVKPPPIKLEPFSGDVESWSRFWEQFESSIDNDPHLSTVNKHAFLHGYLEGEPKLLVEGIPVSASTYEDTKRILHARYGDQNRIIQEHLDYLEDVTPITTITHEALNTMFIECNGLVQALQADMEKTDRDPTMMQPSVKHQEIPTEEDVVIPVRGLKKRRRVRNLAAERRQKKHKRIREFCRSRKVSRHAIVAWRKGNFMRQIWTVDIYGPLKVLTAARTRMTRHAKVAQGREK